MSGNTPAYPVTTKDGMFIESGLSKRELIAAMALQGLCSNPAYSGHAEVGAEKLTQWAVAQSDLLIAELSKETP